jgi:GDP-L-fucose synthase
MKVFVTGATGFLGTHLCKALVDEGYDVTAIGSKDCDLTKKESLYAYKEKYDLIFHLAAWTQAGDFCLHHPGEQWILNQLINTHVLSWWHEEQSQAKMIAIGTSCCYEPGTPHVEESFLTANAIESLFTYAMTKRMLYTGLLALNKQFGHKYLFLIPSTLYGPDYHLDGRQMHFIFDLMRKIVDGKETGSTVTLWGDGSQSRELIHVNDFTEAAINLTENIENEIVNIGGGIEKPIKWYAEELSRIVGFDSSKIEYDLTKYVGAKSKVLVIDKLRKLLPEFKHREIGEGLEEIVLWYKSQLDK